MMALAVKMVDDGRILSRFGQLDDFWSHVFTKGRPFLKRAENYWVARVARGGRSIGATVWSSVEWIVPFLCWDDLKYRRDFAVVVECAHSRHHHSSGWSGENRQTLLQFGNFTLSIVIHRKSHRACYSMNIILFDDKKPFLWCEQ